VEWVAAEPRSRCDQRRVRLHRKRLSDCQWAQRHSWRDLVGAPISHSSGGELVAGARDHLADGNPRARTIR